MMKAKMMKVRRMKTKMTRNEAARKMAKTRMKARMMKVRRMKTKVEMMMKWKVILSVALKEVFAKFGVASLNLSMRCDKRSVYFRVGDHYLIAGKQEFCLQCNQFQRHHRDVTQTRAYHLDVLL